MRKKRILLPIFSLFIFLSAAAQDKWDLRRCVEYAWANNISVRQADVQARLAEIDHTASKWARYPAANFSTSAGLQFGRSIDPNTNQFTSGSSMLLFHSFSVNAGVDVFNWHRLKNNVIGYQYAHMASLAAVDKVKNDVALNVATNYLTVLLNRKQVDIARVTMEQTRNQMVLTRRKVAAGSLPELDALTFESQYATDSSLYIGTMATADQALLDLKALLNLDAAAPFDIVTPPVDNIPIEPLLELQPDKVFESALKNQPAQKEVELRIQGLEAIVKSVRAAQFPTISLFGGLGSQFSSSDSKITGFQFLGYSPADPLSPVVDVGGTIYPILTPDVRVDQGKKSFGELWDGWGTQIDNSFRQNIGISISVPILNGGSAKFAYRRAKINLDNIKITKEQVDQVLKNNVYKAYYTATAALQKFNASATAMESAQKSYDFATRRFDLGLLNSFDLITSQNNLTRARLDNALSQFDYVFKMKVLEFWKGLGIRL
jgi:outer membrane protein